MGAVKRESRGTRRDAEATRTRIVMAAEQAFVEHGFDGARVDDIATAAEANKRMLYAYFGSKEGLYVEVLRRNFERVSEVSRAASDPALDPRAQAAEVIARYFRFLRENRGFVRLVAWEGASSVPHAGDAMTEVAASGLSRFRDALQRGVEEGVFRADLDVGDLVLSVSGLGLSYFGLRAMRQALRGTTDDSTEAHEAYLGHVLRLVFDGIMAQSEAKR